MGVNAIIIGAGLSGIAMAHKLKHEIGFEDFTIYEKLDGIRWTGCDVHSQLCSFSFNLNPNWSKELAEQGEILQYIEDTVDKFHLRPHINTFVECVGAAWDSESAQWIVQMKDLKTGINFTRRSTRFVSAVGGISFPRDVHFEGMEDFKGPMFHTARWRHDVDYTGKRVYARSPQWYHERPNHQSSPLEKAAFRYLPILMRLRRWNIFWSIDKQSYAYRGTEDGTKQRLKEAQHARNYIYKKAPEKYHDILVPDFE
ncbi:Monooxygenase protein [Diaporthe amygdali]|uniref:Monooxygenase protein n=1 Tax=Phomopsis amygdali TaxID=1214568 RepID=UPI0022FECBDA|nr:Monooxygenase protein [Diaporthe amygdali]KAJ0108808.1 Monooxygenase protein [Diaporthe amygdali]